MGNIIPYSISDDDNTSYPNHTIKKSEHNVNVHNIKFLTIPSIPKPEDRPFQLDKKQQMMNDSNPETMDLRPLIEKPYTTSHPLYQSYHANIEIVARQLECMIQNWTGRVSRKFWDFYSKRSLTSIREIYDCVKKYGLIPETQEHRMELASTRV
jgi:hypothetical protein